MIQLMVPGPPHFAFVAYFKPKDESILTSDTPFGRLAQPFFFGEDDDFRDEHFKLIPKVPIHQSQCSVIVSGVSQVVQGNFIVKNAVGAKPAILGKKLKQHYFRGNKYFELDVDIASSSVSPRPQSTRKSHRLISFES